MMEPDFQHLMKLKMTMKCKTSNLWFFYLPTMGEWEF